MSSSRYKLAVLLLVASCGADHKRAPRATRHPAQHSCRGLADIMPNFLRAVRSGQTEGLSAVVQEHLLAPARQGEPAPMLDVVRGVFAVLSQFAQEPAERGALPGESCAERPPRPEDGHPLCELRRGLDALLHEGQSHQAVALFGPVMASALDYVSGRNRSPPHYEVSAVVSEMCRHNAACQMTDTLDLLAAIAAFARTDEGRAALVRLDALVADPELGPYLMDGGHRYGGIEGVVALARVLLSTLQTASTPSDIDSLRAVISLFPANLRPKLELALDDAKVLLDPKRAPNVLRPLQRFLGCYQLQDANLDVVRMLYRLGLEGSRPELTVGELVHRLRRMLESDQRGTLLHLVERVVRAVRQDAQVSQSLGRTCHQLFEPTRNAPRALPVLAQLLATGVVEETICALDTVVYGCAGGSQPACLPAHR